MPPPLPSLPRPRNAAATRQAMLNSATRHFARESYENVGLREIARDAGVDPALVSRYFGSKEQLFKEALRGDRSSLLDGIRSEELASHLAGMVVDHHEQEDGDAGKIECLMMVLRSASSPKASEIVRDALSEDLVGPISRLLGGADCDMRASLAMAILMGSGIMRTAMSMGPLCSEDDACLRARLTDLFETALADTKA